METGSFVQRAKDRVGPLRYRNWLTYARGTDPISIDELISPLRYDVVVRMQHFRFLRRNAALLEDDLDSYVRRARNHPYFVWFREVHCRRLHPRLLRDAATFDAAFVRRLRRSAALYRAFSERGLDRRSPVVLHAGGTILPTGAGKLVNRPVYMGEGCHRLALLRLAGHRWLEPDRYVIRRHPTYEPVDNTGVLLGCLPVSSPEYLEFLSLGYGDGAPVTRGGLLDHVRRRQPDRLEELTSILRLDEPKLSPSIEVRTGGSA